MNTSCAINNIDSLESDNLLQFLAKINTSGSKTPTKFHTNYDYRQILNYQRPCCELFPRRSRDQETLGYLSSRSSSLLRTRCASLQSSKSKLLLSTVEFIPFKGEGYIEVETI